MAGFFTTNKRKMKTYILLKDLPNVKAGAKSEYKNEHFCFDEAGVGYAFKEKEIADNPEWFKEKEEKPTITDWYNDGIDAKNPCNPRAGISFEFNNNLKPIYISKERLAELLIAENKGELFIDTKEDRNEKRGRLYTQKELLEAEEKAFNNAQLLVKHSSFDSNELEYEFKTVRDYRNYVSRNKDH